MELSKIIELAKANSHLGNMQGSAKFAISQARGFAGTGQDEKARFWALKSLSYSVGIHSPIYAEAAKGE